MFIALSAVICDAEHFCFTEIETFEKAKGAWFLTFLELSNNLPLHGTLVQVLSLLHPAQI